MKRRLRNILKWACTAASVLLLVLWVGSTRRRFHLEAPPTTDAAVVWGRLHVSLDWPWKVPTNLHWWTRETDIRSLRWGFEFGTGNFNFSPTGETSYWVIIIPVWSIACLVALPGVWIWYRDRRRAPGLCAKCGYDLRGANHKVCPECGAAKMVG